MLKLPWYGSARPHEDHPQIFMRSVLVLVGGVERICPNGGNGRFPLGCSVIVVHLEAIHGPDSPSRRLFD